MMNSYKFVLVC